MYTVAGALVKVAGADGVRRAVKKTAEDRTAGVSTAVRVRRTAEVPHVLKNKRSYHRISNCGD